MDRAYNNYTGFRNYPHLRHKFSAREGKGGGGDDMNTSNRDNANGDFVRWNGRERQAGGAGGVAVDNRFGDGGLPPFDNGGGENANNANRDGVDGTGGG